MSLGCGHDAPIGRSRGGHAQCTPSCPHRADPPHPQLVTMDDFLKQVGASLQEHASKGGRAGAQQVGGGGRRIGQPEDAVQVAAALMARHGGGDGTAMSGQLAAARARGELQARAVRVIGSVVQQGDVSGPSGGVRGRGRYFPGSQQRTTMSAAGGAGDGTTSTKVTVAAPRKGYSAKAAFGRVEGESGDEESAGSGAEGMDHTATGGEGSNRVEGIKARVLSSSGSEYDEDDNDAAPVAAVPKSAPAVNIGGDAHAKGPMDANLPSARVLGSSDDSYEYYTEGSDGQKAVEGHSDVAPQQKAAPTRAATGMEPVSQVEKCGESALGPHVSRGNDDGSAGTAQPQAGGTTSEYYDEYEDEGDTATGQHARNTGGSDETRKVDDNDDQATFTLSYVSKANRQAMHAAKQAEMERKKKDRLRADAARQALDGAVRSTSVTRAMALAAATEAAAYKEQIAEAIGLSLEDAAGYVAVIAARDPDHVVVQRAYGAWKVRELARIQRMRHDAAPKLLTVPVY